MKINCLGEACLKIRCLSCSHNINLEYESYSDYGGEIKCYACGAILEVKLSEEHVKSVKLLRGSVSTRRN